MSKYDAEDFSYTACSKGYDIKYKDRSIGGAGTVESSYQKEKVHWKHAQANHQMYVDNAKRTIDMIVDGRGGRIYEDNIRKIEMDLLRTSYYGYSINLDERGDFYADVRDMDDKSIFEIKSDATEDGDLWIVEDGFMRDVNDLDGLHDYLVDMGLIDEDAEVLELCDFEEKQEDYLAWKAATPTPKSPGVSM